MRSPRAWSSSSSAHRQKSPAGSARSPRPALHVHGRAGQKGGVPLPWLRRERRRYQPLHRLRVCTTRCEFDAIHLRRDHPEATKMIRSEDKMKAILPYMVKRAARIKVKELRSKRS